MMDVLNHKMTIYKACTLEDLLWIFVGLFGVGVVWWGVWCQIVLGSFLLGVLLALVTVLVWLRPAVGMMSYLKQDKPKGYFRHWRWLQWQRLGWGTPLYLTYQGTLTVGRSRRKVQR